MENEKRSLLKDCLTYGLVIALAQIGISLLMYLLGMSLENWVSWVSFAVTVYLLWRFIKKYRDTVNGGLLSYGRGFSVGMLSIFIASIVATIYTYLFFTVIDPTIIDQILDKTYEEILQNTSSEEEADMAMEMTLPWLTPNLMTFYGFMSNMFFGLIASLILPAILKKEDTI